MDDILSVDLKLEQTEIIRGESAYFTVVLKNVSKDPIADLPDFNPVNKSVTIMAKGARDTRQAKQERYGPYEHIDEENVITLNPGQTLTMRGDLLSWVGELEPGPHQITATYTGEMLPAESKPVTLNVLPALPIFSSTPRQAAQSPAGQLAAAWVHKRDADSLLFYQHQNPGLPRITVHCVRAVEQKVSTAVFAANLATASATTGHIVWTDEKDKLQFALADTEKPSVGKPVAIKTPFKGEPLASPLSASPKKLWIPFVDPKLEKVVILEVDAGGDAKVYELDLGKSKPLGPYSCFWEFDARLHFSWTSQGGREIHYARLPLDAPATGFATRSVHISNDPIAWIDAYLDTDGAFRQQPYLEETIPESERGKPVPAARPGVSLWCVTETPASLVCTRVNTATGQSQAGPSFSTEGAEGIHVIHSVVTYRQELCLLLRDAKDKLYYAGTERGVLKPLSDVVGEEITPSQHPSLIAAGRAATDPWVYLRYIRDKKMIDYFRLEPADAQDPVEQRSAKQPALGGTR